MVWKSETRHLSSRHVSTFILHLWEIVGISWELLQCSRQIETKLRAASIQFVNLKLTQSMNSSSGEVWDTFLFTPFFYNDFTLADSPIWYWSNGEPNFWFRQSWLHQLEQELSLLFYLHIPASSSLSIHTYVDDRLPTLMLIVSNCPSIITLRAGPPSIHAVAAANEPSHHDNQTHI